ncbi:DUF4116 domain-containing protein, partial [Endozoicomonas sp. SESOKO2]|uniref:DUF4116 domain-containing protein n=1 Tax=Endozoicomonas sp. SESOKO2 TaxID=2828743 RepID=UPI0021477A81
PIKLSMSPQRSELLAETVDNVNRLIHGAEALLEGYRAFLLLAGNSDSEEVQSLLDELMQLTSRFVTLKQTIQSGLESITRHQQTGEERQLSFIKWVADCYQLKSFLQALNPGKAEQVLSVHELIFALHQRFVKALAPVTLASGHGRVSEEKRVTYVDCTTPGDSGEKASLLSPSCKTSIKKLEYSGTVVSMDDALIVNLELGSHICVIELLENAEGGKGRTLRLKFSDQFRSTDGSDKRGKLMRMWFLVQLLKVIKLDKQADSMKLSCSAVTSEMIVEYPQMKSREILQEAFEKLTIVLDAMCDLDLLFSDNDIFEEYHWDFNMLAQRLNPDVATEADRFTFQHCLFSMFYLGDERISPDCCQLLSNHLQQFVHYAERLGECQSLVFLRQKPEHSLREILMSNEMSESIRRELLHHYLLLDPHYSIRLVEDFYPHLRGQYFVIKPSRDYTLTLDVPPSQSLLDIKEKIRKTMVKGGLKYVSQRVRNDQELVLEVIAVKPLHLKYVSEELKCDKGVVMAAVTQDGYCLSYASQQLQDDDEVVMAAMAEYPRALQYASERIRSDKSII